MSSLSSRMPKLVIVTTVPETLATILSGQPRWLNQQMEVHCITSPGYELERIADAEHVMVHALPMQRGISPLRDLIAIMRMWCLLLRLAPDIIHSYTPKAGLVAMLASFAARVPVRVHTFTGLIFPTATGLKRWVLVRIDRLICAAATWVVPEGEGVKRDMIASRITKKPMKVIGSGNIAGVDTNYFAPEHSESLQIEGFVFCFVGRLNRDKGIGELVAAFLELPDSAQLLLVGQVDETAPVDSDVMAVIQQHPRIHAVGFLSDIRPALVSASVLVLPSYREGFPNVVLQGGAMALPVIASDINGCNEVIEPGFNGWLVPTKDTGALAQAMAEAMALTREELSKMGLNARRRISERFERDHYLDRLMNFYREVLT
ncbi:glycosyltransferase family 4 protein [Marinobacter sp.]|uniref:glycosyltransferase family 4 protein n=1 Tax=Marinobacter sp. TaxID=50741 RepID=UPI0025C6B8F6|nr:glycosyltransferase family 4 protein [Marinobacter sp.]